MHMGSKGSMIILGLQEFGLSLVCCFLWGGKGPFLNGPRLILFGGKHSLKFNSEFTPKKWMAGILVSFSDGLFSGAMLVLGRVDGGLGPSNQRELLFWYLKVSLRGATELKCLS